MLPTLLLLGCARDCPVPAVTGDPEDDRIEVQHAMDQFFRAIGDRPICLESVSVQESLSGPEGEFGGLYEHDPPTIQVRAGGHVWRKAMHELGHSAEAQFPELLTDHRSLWTSDNDEPDRPREKQMSDRFANTCEPGPLAIQLAEPGSCSNDRDPGPFEVIATELFVVRVEEGRHLPWVWTEHASHDVSALELTQIRIHPAEDGTYFRLVLGVGEGSGDRNIDLHTGESIGASVVPEPEVIPAPYDWAHTSSAVTADGTAWTVSWDNPGKSLLQRIVWEDESGVSALGCGRPLEVVFAIDGGLWSAWVDKGVIRWGRWGPSEAS